MAWPREYGGQDASNVKSAIFAEEMTYHEAPGKDNWGIGMLAPAIMQHGTPEQKRKYLPPIARGETTWCQGFSEPESGSDLASLSTRAVRDGNDYLITGRRSGPARPTAPTGCSCRSHGPRRPQAPRHHLLPCRPQDPASPSGPSSTWSGTTISTRSISTTSESRARTSSGGEQGLVRAMTTLNSERDGTMYTAKARKPLDLLMEFVKAEGAGRRCPGPCVTGLRRGIGNRGQPPSRLSDRLDGRPGPRGPAGSLHIQDVQHELLLRVANTGMQLLGLMGQLTEDSKWARSGETPKALPLEHQRGNRRRHLGGAAQHNRHEGAGSAEGYVKVDLQHLTAIYSLRGCNLNKQEQTGNPHRKSLVLLTGQQRRFLSTIEHYD